MTTPARVILAVGIITFLSCGFFAGCLLLNSAHYERERQEMLLAGRKTVGKESEEALKLLHSMPATAGSEVYRSGSGIHVVSKRKFVFIGTYAFPAIELKLDSNDVVREVRLLEVGAGL